MNRTYLPVSFLFLLSTAVAQAAGESAPKPSSIYRGDIDAVIAALRHGAVEQHLPALGGDVASTGMVLTAMAKCHRRYHISDGPVVRPSVEFLVGQQRADGSFGDATATAWAVTGLLAIDPIGQQQVAGNGAVWLVANKALAEPFAAAVAAIAAKPAATPPAPEALQRCRAWLANAKTSTRAEVAAALVQLVACQVAGAKPDAAAPAPAAVFSPAQQRGIDWLLAEQKDGVFTAAGKRSDPLTGFGLMALQSKPKALRTAREQAVIDQGLRWVVGTQNEDGTWGESLQNYTTCVIVGALDRWQDPSTAPLLAKAQRALLTFQHCEADGYQRSDRDYGSVGYGGSQRGDLSNLHFSLQALRQTGLPSTDEAFARAVVFLQRTQNLTKTNDFAGKVPDPERADVMLDVVSGDDGGACYYPGNSSAGYVVRPDGKTIARSYGSMTYALLKAYTLAGVPASDPRMQAAVTWIQNHWELAVNPGVDPALG